MTFIPSSLETRRIRTHILKTQENIKRVNRDSTITYYQILKVIQESDSRYKAVNHYRLIYSVRLSADTYIKYVSKLLECELITETKLNTFVITPKGNHFIELIKRMKELLPNDNGLYILPKYTDSSDDDYE